MFLFLSDLFSYLTFSVSCFYMIYSCSCFYLRYLGSFFYLTYSGSCFYLSYLGSCFYLTYLGSCFYLTYLCSCFYLYLFRFLFLQENQDLADRTSLLMDHVDDIKVNSHPRMSSKQYYSISLPLLYGIKHFLSSFNSFSCLLFSMFVPLIDFLFYYLSNMPLVQRDLLTHPVTYCTCL